MYLNVLKVLIHTVMTDLHQGIAVLGQRRLDLSFHNVLIVLNVLNVLRLGKNTN